MSAPSRIDRVRNIREVPLDELTQRLERKKRHKEERKNVESHDVSEPVTALDFRTFFHGGYGESLKIAYGVWSATLESVQLPRTASLANCPVTEINDITKASVLLPSIGDWEPALKEFFTDQLPHNETRVTLQDMSAVELLPYFQSPIRYLKIKSGMLSLWELNEIARVVGGSLETLDLTDVVLEDVDVLIPFFNWFTKLKEIRCAALLSKEEQLRASNAQLERFVIDPNQVTELDLSATDLDDERLERILDRYPRLERLDISGCNKVTHLPSRLFHLVSLDASGTSFDHDSLSDLMKKCPHVQELALRDCSQLHYYDGVVLKRLAHLEVSEVPGGPTRQEILAMLTGR